MQIHGALTVGIMCASIEPEAAMFGVAARLKARKQTRQLRSKVRIRPQSPVSAGANVPSPVPFPGGKNSFAPLIVYARSTPRFTSVSSVAMPSAFTTNVGPMVKILLNSTPSADEARLYEGTVTLGSLDQGCQFGKLGSSRCRRLPAHI